MKKHCKGFTLIDILLSIAIVSFLSSIVLFNVAEGRRKADDAKMQVESSQIATALEMYKSENNGFTPLKVSHTHTARGILYKEGTQEYNNAMGTLMNSGHISAIPRSSDGQSYAYGENEEGTSAIFVAHLKTKSSSNPSSKNSCDTIASSQTLSNCHMTMCHPFFPPEVCYWGTFCNTYKNQYPNTICVEWPQHIFCDIHNRDGVFDNIWELCPNPGEPGYGTYGGSLDYPSYGLPATVCNISSNSVCDGSNPNDYCVCI